MVLYIVKRYLHPDKAEAYAKWVKSAIERQMAVEGVVELRAYRAAAGTHRIMATYECADIATWVAWQSHEDIQKTRNELDALATEVTTELWGPSPIYPVPIRPGKWTLEFRVQGGKEGYPSTKMGRSGLSLGQGVHREMKSEGARRRCSLTSS